MTHNTRFTGSMTGLPTPREVRIERDLLDLQERVASRPALVALDLEERRVLALESLAASLAQIAAARRTPDPIAYTVAWITKEGEAVIDKTPTTLATARAELADYRARWPEMTHTLVALVPVVAP